MATDWGEGADALPLDPQESLWDVIAAAAPPQEHNEIRRIIGTTLVEEAEGLHKEVMLLLEIWRDYRTETAEQEAARSQEAAALATAKAKEAAQEAAPAAAPKLKILPEPPEIRERLRQEIKFFVENLADIKEMSNKVDDTIINYALGQDGTSRPSTSSSSASSSSAPGSTASTMRPRTASSARDGRDVPLRPASGDTPKMKALKSVDGVSIESLESSRHNMIQAFQSEIAALKEDIDFLRLCLDEEKGYRDEALRLAARGGRDEPASGGGGGEVGDTTAAAAVVVPTLQQLREARAALEKQYLSGARVGSGGKERERDSREKSPKGGSAGKHRVLPEIRRPGTAAGTPVDSPASATTSPLARVLPSPPVTSPKSARPTSAATRLRKMVMEARTTTE